MNFFDLSGTAPRKSFWQYKFLFLHSQSRLSCFVIDRRSWADRRFGGPSLISRENVTGRASRILFSSSGQPLLVVWSWRWDRVFKAVR